MVRNYWTHKKKLDKLAKTCFYRFRTLLNSFPRLSQWPSPVFHDVNRLIACYGCMYFDVSVSDAVVPLSQWKLEAPKCQFSPAGQSLIQPLLEPFKHNLSQNSPIKMLFQPTVGPISALTSKSALSNWTVLALIKGEKLDPPKRTVFYSSKRPLFLGLKQIFLIYSVLENNHKTFLSGLPQPRKRCLPA